jgi:hypothetical protein
MHWYTYYKHITYRTQKYTYIYTCIPYIHSYIYTACMLTNIQDIYITTNTHTHTHTYIHTHIHTYIYTYMHTYIHTHTHAHTHTHTHTNTHKYTHAHTHTHTHTHTHIHKDIYPSSTYSAEIFQVKSSVGFPTKYQPSYR